MIDTIGTELYAARYQERRTSHIAMASLAVVAVAELAAIVMLARRPEVTRYVRIDEVGHAQAITYNDLSYSPREGEIRTFLHEWATARYGLLQALALRTYPKSYLFLSEQLASRIMTEDAKARTVARVIAGQSEENDVEISSITFAELGHERIRNVATATGTALVDLTKSYSDRKERWRVTVAFYLNPEEVAGRARSAPQFAIVNPLGLIITEFHEAQL